MLVHQRDLQRGEVRWMEDARLLKRRANLASANKTVTGRNRHSKGNAFDG